MSQAAAPSLPKTDFTSMSSSQFVPRWFFAFFFFSGFCSLLYEVIWLRLGMASFGVTTPLVSIFLSIFLAGLGLGSWAVGKLARKYESRPAGFFVRLYAETELLIGLSALLVPAELLWARRVLDLSGNGSGLSMGNAGYYVAAAGWLVLVLLPWCTCMGATLPLAMAAIRRSVPSHSERSFSWLYLANVFGGVLGALSPAFVLVELLGFRGTLLFGAGLNFAIFIAAISVAFSAALQQDAAEINPGIPAQPLRSGILSRAKILALLFATGLLSLAMEVAWIRQFTPYLGTTIWSFAAVLAVYLTGTFAGSTYYRHWIQQHSFGESAFFWIVAGVTALFPCLTGDPRLALGPLVRVTIGIFPFTAVLGFLTPMLVDELSAGSPDIAGQAYSVNILGCLVGPIISGFLLLPFLGEHSSVVLLSLPLFLVPFLFGQHFSLQSKRLAASLAAVALILVLFTGSFENIFPQRVVYRDYSATTIATGRGRAEQLIVNGVLITALEPETKVMAHLPLAFLSYQPHNALDICLGMGTTYRSLATWDVAVTAVELLPSVAKSFSYFHPNLPSPDNVPHAHVVIDDGRLFLERTRQQFDVITIDPPPPMEAAASSLLYSKDFYRVLRKRLRPGGILQQWTPGGDPTSVIAVTMALKQSFPYVRAFIGIEGWGLHFLASDRPIQQLTAAELAAKLTPAAQRDLVEWGPFNTPEAQFAAELNRELNPDQIIALLPGTHVLDDDHPVNEYCFLRRWNRKRPISSFLQAFHNSSAVELQN
jgi:spermidine synthase